MKKKLLILCLLLLWVVGPSSTGTQPVFGLLVTGAHTMGSGTKAIGVTTNRGLPVRQSLFQHCLVKLVPVVEIVQVHRVFER